MIIKSLKDVKKTSVVMDGVKDAFRQVPIGKSDGSPNISFPGYSRLRRVDTHPTIPTNRST
jgi:hypothetical protein